MAKAQVAARFVTEVAPPQLVSIMRRRHKAPRSGGLDTIAEDDREHQLAYGDNQAAATAAGAPSARAFSMASLKRASPTTGGFMRELISCFSSNVVHARVAGGGWDSWECRHKGHARQAVYAHQNKIHGKLS